MSAQSSWMCATSDRSADLGRVEAVGSRLPLLFGLRRSGLGRSTSLPALLSREDQMASDGSVSCACKARLSIRRWLIAAGRDAMYVRVQQTGHLADCCRTRHRAECRSRIVRRAPLPNVTENSKLDSSIVDWRLWRLFECCWTLTKRCGRRPSREAPQPQRSSQGGSSHDLPCSNPTKQASVRA